ncbi:MAG TPA: twin-arginine translocase TatA/TatE family subunit [Candidatus Binatia bacterium]
MGLGIPELLIILIVVLIIFGPGKLPALGSGVGNALRNFRKAVNQPDAIDVTPPQEDDANRTAHAQSAGDTSSANTERSA